jgi:HEAT repeat protein
VSPETRALIAKLTAGLKNVKPAERVSACKALGELGAKGKAASRDLCSALMDSSRQVRLAAADALEKVNPAVAKLAITILIDNNYNARLKAVQRVADLKAEGNPAVPVLLHFKQQSHDGGAIVSALVAVAPEEKQIASLLTTWLVRDTDPGVRLAVARLLPQMEDGKAGIPALIIALKADQSEAVQIAVARTLGEFGRDAKDAVPVLELAKRASSARLREAAENALDRIAQGK